MSARRLPPLLVVYLSTILTIFFTRNQFLPTTYAALLGRNSYISKTKKSGWGIIVSNIVRRGGGGDEEETEVTTGDDVNDEKKRFEALLRRAQIDPSQVFNNDDGDSVLSPLQQLMSQGNVDLLVICQAQCWHESNLKPDDDGRAQYQTHKNNFVTEMQDHLENAALEEDQQTEGEGNKKEQEVLIHAIIRLLGSDYLHSNMFVMENFRQQVLGNPVWRAMVKTSLITHLEEKCPLFDDIIQDGNLWTEALFKCKEE